MSIRTILRYGRDVRLIKLGIKKPKTVITMLRALMDKIHIMQEQVGNMNRDMEILRTKKKY